MTMENVVLTPHIAASTSEALDRMAQMCVDNIDCYLKGKEMPGKRII